MALELNLQRPVGTNSDGTVLQVYDDTGDGNSGWGAGGNPNYTDIDNANYFLTLTITIYTPDNTDGTAYTAIDFYTYNGEAPSSLSDLSFLLDMSDLLSGGTAAGDSTDNFPDGMYKFVYTLEDDQGVEIDSLEIWDFIYTQVQNSIFDLLGEVPEEYIQNKEKFDSVDMEKSSKLLYLESMLEGITTNVSEARTSKLLEMLTNLETLISNYPNI